MNDYKLLKSAYVDNTAHASKEGFTPYYNADLLNAKITLNIPRKNASQRITDIINDPNLNVGLDYGYIFEPKPFLPAIPGKPDAELAPELTVEIPIDISNDPVKGYSYYLKKINSTEGTKPTALTYETLAGGVNRVVAGYQAYDRMHGLDLPNTAITSLYDFKSGVRTAPPIIKKRDVINDNYRSQLFYRLKLTDASGKEYPTTNGYYYKKAPSDKLFLVVTSFGETINNRYAMIEVVADPGIPSKPTVLKFFVSMITGSKA